MKKSDLKEATDFLFGRRGFSNASNYRGPVGEVNTLPSMTVPDMSLSLRDLLDRHLSGGKVKTFNPVNVPEGSMIPVGLERMSPIDREVFRKETADFIATTRGGIVSARQARERAAFYAKVKADVMSDVAADAASDAE